VESVVERGPSGNAVESAVEDISVRGEQIDGYTHPFTNDEDFPFFLPFLLVGGVCD
jgi:hypothetical protein